MKLFFLISCLISFILLAQCIELRLEWLIESERQVTVKWNYWKSRLTSQPIFRNEEIDSFVESEIKRIAGLGYPVKPNLSLLDKFDAKVVLITYKKELINYEFLQGTYECFDNFWNSQFKERYNLSETCDMINEKSEKFDTSLFSFYSSRVAQSIVGDRDVFLLKVFAKLRAEEPLDETKRLDNPPIVPEESSSDQLTNTTEDSQKRLDRPLTSTSENSTSLPSIEVMMKENENNEQTNIDFWNESRKQLKLKPVVESDELKLVAQREVEQYSRSLNHNFNSTSIDLSGLEKWDVFSMVLHNTYVPETDDYSLIYKCFDSCSTSYDDLYVKEDEPCKPFNGSNGWSFDNFTHYGVSIQPGLDGSFYVVRIYGRQKETPSVEKVEEILLSNLNKKFEFCDDLNELIKDEVEHVAEKDDLDIDLNLFKEWQVLVSVGKVESLFGKDELYGDLRCFSNILDTKMDKPYIISEDCPIDTEDLDKFDSYALVLKKSKEGFVYFIRVFGKKVEDDDESTTEVQDLTSEESNEDDDSTKTLKLNQN